MVANRHISKIIIVVMAAAVALCFLAIAFSGELNEKFGGPGVTMEYESRLFNTEEPITIDIQMDEDDWNTMLSNAISEEYYECDVVVNGQKVSHVGIRPKGNTSLSAIAMDPDSDRFSLKLEFDHFMDGQTCYGLDKLILNNNYADATNMKEAVIYDMYQYIGAVSSLYNYAQVSVNGEYWGVYLALEGVEQSFMLRNFGTQDGELYKPDSMEMGGGENDSQSAAPASPGPSMPDMSNMDFSAFGRRGSSVEAEEAEEAASEGGFSFDPNNMPEGGFSFDPNNMPEGGFSFDPGSMPEGGFGFDADNMPENASATDLGSVSEEDGSGSGTDSGSASEEDGSGSGTDSGSRPERTDFSPSGAGGFSMGKGGANLNYTDDDPDSYSTIWEGEITKTGNKDHSRVITALKNISEGNELEKYLDVDNVLKYMAVHTFAVNMDSLSGSMAHNYYLYEYDGQLNIFPWDYNLSFSGMSMGGGSGATEMVNDAIDTPFSGTKFFDAQLSNEEYLERYHAYLQQLVDEYVNGGRFDEVYQRITDQIDSLVETDPTAFYSYEEYRTASEMLYETIKLRAQSIEGQLSGTIPSTDAGQRQDTSALIDASHIDVKAMGEFDMGGSAGGADKSSETSDDTGSAGQSETSGDTAGNAGRSENGNTGDNAAGFSPGNMPDMGSFNPGDMPDMGSFTSGDMPDMSSFNPEDMPDMSNFNPGDMPDLSNINSGNMPDMGNAGSGNMPDMSDAGSGNMPDMGSFAPGSMSGGDTGSGNTSGEEDAGTAGADNSSQETQNAEETSGIQESRDASGSAEDKNSSGSGSESESGSGSDSESENESASSSDRSERRRMSFSGMSGMPGMPGQSAGQTRQKNLITFGICLAGMLAALFIVRCFRRKK